MKIRCPCCQVEFSATEALTELAKQDTKRLNFLERDASSIFTELEAELNGDFKMGVECWVWFRDRGDVYKRPFKAQTYRSAIDRAMTAKEKGLSK